MDNTRLGALRQAVLESWTLTYQRETRYARELEKAEDKRRTFFTRYAGARARHPKEVEVEFQGRAYMVFEPVPEAVEWVPFAVLLQQFEAAVREDERGHHG